PNLVLAYLNKGLKLDVKLDIETGVGYSASDDRVTGEIGLIPLDASFSPVTRVKYEIEETRVGRLTNYDKLILDVWTDGTINPKEALVTSAKILVSYFSQIVSPKKVKDEVKKDIDILGPTGKLSVEEIGLPTRVANALLKAGHETVEDLIKAKRDDLVRVRNLGEKSVKIIEAALGEKGINLSQQ
ncbi:MAG: DNA-directed RNA polymerase subunit alpha, partial [Microgenomates group bacterium GW2011_GWC1_37_8]